MHIGDKQIQAAIVIVIEELNPHGAPGGSRKIGLSLLDKTLPALVLVVMIRAHHIQKVDVGPAIAIDIRNGGISAPTMRSEPHRRGHVLQFVVAQIAIEDRVLESLWIHMAGKRVRQSCKLALSALLLRRVLPHVAYQKIEPAIVVVVEKRAFRVTS